MSDAEGAATGPVVLDKTSEKTCPRHPDRRATGPCVRCGTFVCQPCESEAGCSDCRERALSGLPAIQTRTWVTMGALAVGAGADGCSSVGSLGGAMVVGDPDLTLIVDLLVGLVDIGGILIFLITVVAFLMWLHLAVRRALAKGLYTGVTPGWAVGWWFVPLANLVKPYQAVKGVIQDTGRNLGGLLPAWWALWLISNLVSNVVFRVQLSQGLDAPLSAAMRYAYSFSSFLGCLAGVLCLFVVRGVTKVLTEHRHDA